MEPQKKRFTLSLEIDETFTVDQLWPDGDTPENPTVEDVEKLIDACGGIETVWRDWNLNLSINNFFVWKAKS